MPAGRPPLGPELVEGLEGPDEAKERARVVLETIAGRLTIEEACGRLDVSRARFHEMRREGLEGLIVGLTPGVPGRPRKASAGDASRVTELEREVRELKIDLQAARVKTELAIAMPHVLDLPARHDEDEAAGEKRWRAPGGRDRLHKRKRPR